MTDVGWADVADLFDPEFNGVLPDVVVANTTAADWQAVLELIRSRGWPHRYTEDGQELPLPGAERMIAAGGQVSVELAGQIWAIFRCYQAESVDFDVHLEELQGPGPLAVLCGLLREVGRALGKDVVMAQEGSPEWLMIGYDPRLDRVARLAPRVGP